MAPIYCIEVLWDRTSREWETLFAMDDLSAEEADEYLADARMDPGVLAKRKRKVG